MGGAHSSSSTADSETVGPVVEGERDCLQSSQATEPSPAPREQPIGQQSGDDEICEASSPLSNAASVESLEDPPAASDPDRRKRQCLTLTVLLTATMTSSFAMCLFPPFFPRLAEEKGCSAAIYGFVIGANCLTSFLVTPIIGKNLMKVGVKFSFVWGILIGSVCCATSGLLEFFDPGLEFVFVSTLIRVIHATGNAMVVTSTFTYAGLDFENCVGTVFSLTRTTMNMAQLLGPLVGGALYQWKGFYLPFVVMGAIQGIVGLSSEMLLPNIHGKQASKWGKNKSEEVTISGILKIPSIWFSFVTFIIATACNGFLSINLEPQVLRRFHMRPFYVGLIFGIKDGANSVSSPFWGFICDRGGEVTVKVCMIVSACLAAASFIFLGAGNVIGMDMSLTLPLLISALCLNGIGIGGEQVAGVIDALNETENAGFPDDASMHGLVVGLWSSFSGAGRFISRVGSGILVDNIGFDLTASIVTILQCLVGIATLTYTVMYKCPPMSCPSLKKSHPATTTEEDEAGSEDPVSTGGSSTEESPSTTTMSIRIPERRPSRSGGLQRSLPNFRRNSLNTLFAPGGCPNNIASTFDGL